MSEEHDKPGLSEIKCPANLKFDRKLGWGLEVDKSNPACQESYEQIYEVLGPQARRLLERHTTDISSKKE